MTAPNELPRHERMVAAAVWLAGQGFADIGWAPASDGKAPKRPWKSDATDDPALVPDRLHGARNALVIPKGHGLVIDADDPRAWPELEAAGLPETFRIVSPTPGHGHAYAWADADMVTIPGSFEWGEIRRSSSDVRTSSMVLGPYALRPDGVYEPHNGCRTIATLPDSVVEYLRDSSRRRSQSYAAAQSPTDPGWYIEHGRHEWLVNRARKLRGDSLSGERLYDELVRIDQTRHRPPLADIGRGIEIRQIADWANFHIEDDPPGITLNTKPAAERPTGPVVVMSWADLMAESPTPPPTIRPGIPEVGVVVLAGAPKAGKSLWVSQMALEARRPVLLIIEEGSRAAISFRLRRQAAELGIELPPITLMHRQRIRLDDRASVGRLRSIVAEMRPALIVVDPLNRLHSADENKPSQMTPVMDALAELAYDDGGRAVIAVHHVNKPSADRRGDIWDRLRGASSIRSGTDANLILDGDKGTYRRLVGEFRDADPLIEHLELDRAALLFRQGDAPEAPSKIDPIVLRQFVDERGQVVARQVVEQFSVSKTTAIYALRALGCDEYAGARGALTFSLGTVQ